MALLPWGQMADKNFKLLAKKVPQFSAAKTINISWAATRVSQMNYKGRWEVWVLNIKSSAVTLGTLFCNDWLEILRSLDKKQTLNFKYDRNWILVWKPSPANELWGLLNVPSWEGWISGRKKNPKQKGSAELLKLAADKRLWQPGSNVACQRRGGTERQHGESEQQHKQSG